MDSSNKDCIGMENHHDIGMMLLKKFPYARASMFFNYLRFLFWEFSSHYCGYLVVFLMNLRIRMV
ncbi:hypothetical protein BRADI_4g06562v3 [Brachypodium distachyon]|uniref:Uncharacterized protein n=1 Tax=Brachypodium distachyon TaxID=15368 RepID=A0A0Q3L283_BRADI|nr:hypothetical protein BRADI_4g06562v3 [Brachypodium distachyon]